MSGLFAQYALNRKLEEVYHQFNELGIDPIEGIKHYCYTVKKLDEQGIAYDSILTEQVFEEGLGTWLGNKFSKGVSAVRNINQPGGMKAGWQNSEVMGQARSAEKQASQKHSQAVTNAGNVATELANLKKGLDQILSQFQSSKALQSPDYGNQLTQQLEPLNNLKQSLDQFYQHAKANFTNLRNKQAYQQQELPSLDNTAPATAPATGKKPNHPGYPSWIPDA